MPIPVNGTRTLADILKRRPHLTHLAEIAVVTDSDDSLWDFWHYRIGHTELMRVVETAAAELGQRPAIADVLDALRCVSVAMHDQGAPC